MADLDALRPEVRDALDVVADDARCVCSEAYTSRDMKDPACNHDTMPYIETIRAELLRLAKENADLLSTIELDEQVWIQRDETMHKWIDRARKAESELAALKARIAEAPVAYLTSKTGVGPCNVASMAHGVVFDSSSYGKSVRVVLDE